MELSFRDWMEEEFASEGILSRIGQSIPRSGEDLLHTVFDTRGVSKTTHETGRAFRHGRAMGIKGFDKTQNPFRPDVERHLYDGWLRGWEIGSQLHNPQVVSQ